MKIKNTIVESTPFIQVYVTDRVGGETIAIYRGYWSQNSGVYGYQVCAEYCTSLQIKGWKETKTSGCGYSKESSSFEDFLIDLGIKDRKHDEPSRLLYKYCKGNYCELSLQQLKKAVKRG